MVRRKSIQKLGTNPVAEQSVLPTTQATDLDSIVLSPKKAEMETHQTSVAKPTPSQETSKKKTHRKKELRKKNTSPIPMPDPCTRAGKDVATECNHENSAPIPEVKKRRPLTEKQLENLRKGRMKRNLLLLEKVKMKQINKDKEKERQSILKEIAHLAHQPIKEEKPNKVTPVPPLPPPPSRHQTDSSEENDDEDDSGYDEYAYSDSTTDEYDTMEEDDDDDDVENMGYYDDQQYHYAPNKIPRKNKRKTYPMYDNGLMFV